MATGTFTGTGQTAAVTASRVHIMMDFAGTASVDVEAQMPSGNWIKVATGIVADYDQFYDSGGGAVPIRLNCTAHTNNVEWVLKQAP